LDLKKFAVRAAVAMVFGPFIVFGAWRGGLWFLAIVLVIVSLALYEFYGLCRKKAVHPQFTFGILLGVVVCLMAYAGLLHQAWLILAVATVLMLFLELFRNLPNPLLNLSATLAGVIYIALLLSFLLLTRSLPQEMGLRDTAGAHLIILLFVTIWLCDSAAYILGSRIGRHKLFPRVSPNKTVEGFLAGLLVALCSAACYAYSFLPELRWIDALALGAISGIVGQLSDLVESLFKRDAGLKDASNLIPGHGGMLDRFDSEILVTPLAYCYLKFIVF
jgi:phosphatidate cytidylyltransferase